MAGYITTTELASLGMPSQSLGGVSTPDQEAAIESASRIADGYMAGHYSVPLTSYGYDLKLQVARIASYLLITRRGYNPDANQAYRQGYDDALAWLSLVSRGRVRVSLTTSGLNSGTTDNAPYMDVDESRS